MRAEAIAIVERTLGRRTLAFLADIDPVANVAVMVFPLEPRPETGTVEVAERSAEDR
jgi:hypothetical protein